MVIKSLCNTKRHIHNYSLLYIRKQRTHAYRYMQILTHTYTHTYTRIHAHKLLHILGANLLRN